MYTKGKLPDGTTLSGIDMETDVAVYTRKNFWSKAVRTEDYQVKIHDSTSAYAKDMNNAQYQDVKLVGGAKQGINDRVRVTVGSKTVSSDPILPKEAQNLAEAMKTQEVSDYQYKADKQKQLHEINMGRAVVFGALTGTVLSAVKEICDIIEHGDGISKEQFKKSIEHILCGTADGAMRGGAIMGSVKAVGTIMGKEIATNSLGAIPAMAVANTAVDVAKDLYQCFVAGQIDADDLLCNTVNHAFSSIAGFGGSWAGGQLAGAAFAKSAAEAGAAIGSAAGPLGTLVGSVVGGILIGFGAQAIIKAADKDAQKKLMDCMDRIHAKIELDGFEKLYFFADEMSCLSEYRLSFKNFLPCYNLISDLREYNLKKKALKKIQKQLDDNIGSMEASAQYALRRLGEQQKQRIRELEHIFCEQKEAVRENFRESMELSLANSYVQYAGIIDILTNDIVSMKAKYARQSARQNSIMEYIESRGKVNAYFNQLLLELGSEERTMLLTESLRKFMEQDQMLAGRQYLSQKEALALVRGSDG